MNRYRYVFWFVGVAGAVIMAVILKSLNYVSLSVPVILQYSMLFIFIAGMFTLVILGYIIGRKVE